MKDDPTYLMKIGPVLLTDVEAKGSERLEKT